MREYKRVLRLIIWDCAMYVRKASASPPKRQVGYFKVKIASSRMRVEHAPQDTRRWSEARKMCAISWIVRERHGSRNSPTGHAERLI